MIVLLLCLLITERFKVVYIPCKALCKKCSALSIGGEGIVFCVSQTVRPSVRCSPVNTYFGWRDISVLNEGISTKLGAIFVTWVRIAGKVSTIKGDRSRSCVNAITAQAYISTVWRRGSIVLIAGSAVQDHFVTVNRCSFILFSNRTLLSVSKTLSVSNFICFILLTLAAGISLSWYCRCVFFHSVSAYCLRFNVV